MTNIVSFRQPPRQSLDQRVGALAHSFAQSRRSADDVYWLKENGELLSIVRSTGIGLTPDALQIYRSFYQELPERFRFFPQYYRFLLSIALDLEDLGMDGSVGENLCRQTAQARLFDAELSDLQRAEARHLVSRRVQLRPQEALTERLASFACRSHTFALPNKKAAYELAHIVFYLSDYGQCDPGLPRQAIISLEYAGLLAFLDQNSDLLAEVCIALRFCGRCPSPIWEDWLAGSLAAMRSDEGAQDLRNDHYHEYFVTSQWARLAGYDPFPVSFPDGAVAIRGGAQLPGPMREMSSFLFHLGEGRMSDWAAMRSSVTNALSEGHTQVLCAAEQSTTRFDAFFEGFARAGG